MALCLPFESRPRSDRSATFPGRGIQWPESIRFEGTWFETPSHRGGRYDVGSTVVSEKFRHGIVYDYLRAHLVFVGDP